MFRFALHLDSRLAPKGKDQAWIHADVIEGKMYCKCCKTWIKGGGINRFKQQLAVVRENININWLLLEKLLPHGKLI